jgi:hypothetical protein
LGQEWDKILAGQNCLPIAAQLRHPTSPIAGRDAYRCRFQRKGRYTTFRQLDTV